MKTTISESLMKEEHKEVPHRAAPKFSKKLNKTSPHPLTPPTPLSPPSPLPPSPPINDPYHKDRVSSVG